MTARITTCTRPANECRVLVAEDNLLNALVVEAFLQHFGYAFEIVGGGDQAVDAVKTGNVDVVLLDFHMPGLNGAQAAKAIREWERDHGGRKVYIVGLTASAMPKEVDHCVEAGMDQLMTKPFDIEHLRLVLTKACELVHARWMAGNDRPLQAAGVEGELRGIPSSLTMDQADGNRQQNMTPSPRTTNATVAGPAGDKFVLLLEQQTQEHAIAILDPQGTIIRWNSAAERILGWTQDEVLGKPISIIFTGSDIGMGAPGHELQVASSVGLAEDDRWHIRKDGARVWISGAVTTLKDTAGHILGYGKVMRDRTDLRVQATAQENRVNELTGEHRHRDEYFARLAHEVRNSLGPLRNVLAIMENAQPAQQEFAMSIARRQIEVLTRLAQDAAELATIAAGKLELSLAEVDVADSLRATAEGIREQAHRKHQSVELLFVPGQIVVEADPQRLHQIVFNLLHNAVKYTPAGGKIWLKLTAEDKAAVIRVEDNGVGIDAHLLPKIFDLFTQASVGNSQGGLGVGLALVKDLVVAHHGLVEVRSEGLNKGSDFTVRLPLKQPIQVRSLSR